MTTIQDRLDKNVHFVCSLYKSQYEKSKAVQGESLFHITYTITCEDSHKMIFHANCFPSMYGLVINDLFSDSESSMIVETIENENDYIEKVVSVLSDIMAYKKSENNYKLIHKHDLVVNIISMTKSETWKHEYGDDNHKRASYDHFIFKVNNDITMTITLEYWDNDGNHENINVITFITCTTTGTYEKKMTNVKMSDIMRESIDFINGADRWCCGKIIK